MPSRLRAIASLIATAPLLSGCVAMAIPAAAGGALLRGHHASKQAEQDTSDPALPAGTQLMRTDLTALPPPDTATSTDSLSIDALATFAGAQMAKGADEPRDSALLADPGSLQPTRMDCASLPPAVLVDLDPGKTAFDPQAAGDANPALAKTLAVLRGQGAKIVWVSAARESEAAAIEHKLVASGLDPEGADELALPNASQGNKEAVRTMLAKRYCPIAIVGDSRSDFDDLYLYLKDPASAVALESMINHGWFIASPFPATGIPAGTGDIR